MTARKIKNNIDWDDLINIDTVKEILGMTSQSAREWILRNLNPENGYKKFPQYYIISKKALMRKIEELNNSKK